MEHSKYSSLLFQDLYTKRNIIYQETKLKTIYLINIIDTFLHRWQFLNKDNMKLNTRILKTLYGSTYPKYIDYLIENKFIFLWKNYSAKFKAKTFKLTDKAKNAGIIIVNIDMPSKLLAKINIINTSFNKIDDWLRLKLIDDLYKVTIDNTGVKNWISENIVKTDKAYNVNLVACNKISNKDVYYSFDNFGRFHTNYTVLKKEIRNKFIKLDGYNTKELDITNSQPFFLYILMRDSGFTKFDNFDRDVLNGQIYEKLKEVSGKTRKEVKINVYSILFGRNVTKDYWNLLFDKLYPNVYKWIKEYKIHNSNYKVIAQILQRIESDFIFKTLIPNVLIWNKNLPILTIHDSIIIPEYAYENVKIIFNNTKQELINKFKPELMLQ